MDTKRTKPEILKIPAFEDFRGYLAVPYDQAINFTDKSGIQQESVHAAWLALSRRGVCPGEAGVLPAWFNIQCGCGSAPRRKLRSCLQCGAVF